MRTWIVYFTLKGRNKLLRNKCQNNDLVLAIKTISVVLHIKVASVETRQFKLAKRGNQC